MGFQLCQDNVDNLSFPMLCDGFGPYIKIGGEYDQEIPQSQTADNLVAQRGRAAQPSQDIRKTN